MVHKKFIGGSAIAIVVVAAIVTATLLATSETKKYTSDAKTIAACLKLGPDGFQLFDSRHQTKGVGRLGNALNGIANANPKDVSGVAYCSDYSGVFISVAHPSAALLASIDATRRYFPGPTVVVANVASALTAQLAAEQRVGRMPMSDGLSMIGPNIYTGGLTVGILPTQWPLSKALRRKIEVLATQNGTVPMPLDFHKEGPSHADS